MADMGKKGTILTSSNVRKGFCDGRIVTYVLKVQCSVFGSVLRCSLSVPVFFNRICTSCAFVQTVKFAIASICTYDINIITTCFERNGHWYAQKSKFQTAVCYNIVLVSFSLYRPDCSVSVSRSVLISLDPRFLAMPLAGRSEMQLCAGNVRSNDSAFKNVLNIYVCFTF